MGIGILLSGTGCVGKTTLAHDWLEKYGKNFIFIAEIARGIMKTHSLTQETLTESLKTEDKAEFLELQRLIIEEQNRREISILEADPEACYISDRGPDPLAYTLHYVGRTAVDKLAANPATRACLERYRKSLVVVLCPLERFVEDGVRLTQEYEDAQEFTRQLRGLLDEYKIPHLYIEEADRQKRVEILQQAVRDFKV